MLNTGMGRSSRKPRHSSLLDAAQALLRSAWVASSQFSRLVSPGPQSSVTGPVEIVIAVELVVVAVPVEPIVAFAAVAGVVAGPTLDDVVALAAESLVRSRCPDEDVVARGSPGDLVTACAQMAFWGELTYGSEVA